MVIRFAIAILVLCLVVPSVAMASVQYSPGPYNTKDVPGNQFYSRHAIEYTTGGGGVYTYNQRLYVNVLTSGAVLDCGYAFVEYDSTYSIRYVTSGDVPFTYNNTPRWWYNYYNQTHSWVSGQYVKYINKTGDAFCSGSTVWQLGGWESAVDSNYSWIHYHLTW
ncbi:MAG: hypothetical protein M9890_03750 [Thermomicrobiales bacterium]|nr:hypothetical protein [Thermomicrobiales bacterium]